MCIHTCICECVYIENESLFKSCPVNKKTLYTFLNFDIFKYQIERKKMMKYFVIKPTLIFPFSLF